MFTIAVAGHVCADLTPQLPLGVGMIPGHLTNVGGLDIRPGGCIYNVGRVLHGLGAPARLSGFVGDDDLGDIVTRHMRETGLDTSDIRRTDAIGTSYSIVIEPAGMNRSFWHHNGANEVFTGAEVDLSDTELLHIGYPPLVPGLVTDRGAPLVTLLRRARDADITTSLDLAVVDQNSPVGQLDWHGILDAALAEVDVFSPSIDDLTSALETGPVTTRDELLSLADDMIESGVAIVLLSAGEDGLLIRTAPAERLARGGRVIRALADDWADATVWQDARRIERVTTTNGAGDSASAALLYGLANLMSPADTAELATRVAANWIQGLPVDEHEPAR